MNMNTQVSQCVLPGVRNQFHWNSTHPSITVPFVYELQLILFDSLPLPLKIFHYVVFFHPFYIYSSSLYPNFSSILSLLQVLANVLLFFSSSETFFIFVPDYVSYFQLLYIFKN